MNKNYEDFNNMKLFDIQLSEKKRFGKILLSQMNPLNFSNLIGQY